MYPKTQNEWMEAKNNTIEELDLKQKVNENQSLLWSELNELTFYTL